RNLPSIFNKVTQIFVDLVKKTTFQVHASITNQYQNKYMVVFPSLFVFVLEDIKIFFFVPARITFIIFWIEGQIFSKKTVSITELIRGRMHWFYKEQTGQALPWFGSLFLHKKILLLYYGNLGEISTIIITGFRNRLIALGTGTLGDNKTRQYAKAFQMHRIYKNHTRGHGHDGPMVRSQIYHFKFFNFRRYAAHTLVR
ncbi:hypothetical protein ACJX0J_011290, partial [Zea mays]